jgi:hypothetical protein
MMSGTGTCTARNHGSVKRFVPARQKPKGRLRRRTMPAIGVLHENLVRTGIRRFAGLGWTARATGSVR